MEARLTKPDHQKNEFYRLVKDPWKLRLFLFSKLPAAYFSGVRPRLITPEKCTVSIRYKWFNRNPFRCTYFACLSMAAEMSTGILAMSGVYQRNPGISMLVTSLSGQFYKKATGRTDFTCSEGQKIQQAIDLASTGGTPQVVTVLSSGVDEQGQPVAQFHIEWSFRLKKTQ